MALCRICYLPEESKYDPLLSPCACMGSLKHIHKQCLKRWLKTTINPYFTKYCEICRFTLVIPQRWPTEIVPVLRNTGIWYYLEKTYMPVVLGYALHYNLLCFYFSRGSRYDLYNETVSRHLFLYVASAITLLYGIVYYPLFAQVRNKLRYVSYMCRCSAPRHMRYNPTAFLLTIIGNLVFSGFVGVFPFGAAYLSLLPRVYVIHGHIIRALNDEAEEDF